MSKHRTRDHGVTTERGDDQRGDDQGVNTERGDDQGVNTELGG